MTFAPPSGMILHDALAALVVALAVAGLLAGLFGWRRPGSASPRGAVAFLVLLLFPPIWLIGVWVRPLGPPLAGLWRPAFALVGLLLGLVLLAVAPRRRPPADSAAPPPGRGALDAAEAGSAARAFLWILLALIAAGLVIAYRPPIG